MGGIEKTPGCFYLSGVTFSLHFSSGRRLRGGKLFASLGWADCLWKEVKIKKFTYIQKKKKVGTIPSTNGVRQGSTLSSVYFCALLQPILETLSAVGPVGWSSFNLKTF